MFYFDWTYLLLIPGLILGMWAQHRVNSTYREYARIGTQQGRTAAEVAAQLLGRAGADKVRIGMVKGSLTDHYDPARKTLNLSQDVYQSPSIAALGIAAHEAGHALQDQQGYGPLRLRSAAVPVVNIGSRASMPILMLGLIFAWPPVVYIGIALFSLSVVFSLITLPVEFDASRRAVSMLTQGGYLTAGEEQGMRKVLNAAALTYVAAAVSSILSLLRLILIARNRD